MNYYKNTKVYKGDQMVRFCDDTIILYSKYGSPKSYYQNKKKLRWVILQCRLFEYASKFKHQKLTQLFVDLIEGNRTEDLSCRSMSQLLLKEKIEVPAYYHCYECPYLSLKLKSVQ